MKKFLSISLVLLLILAQLPIVGLADDGDETNITIDKVKTSLSKVEVGDVFNLTLTFGIKNLEGISDIQVGISSSESFVLTDSTFKKPLEGKEVSFKLKYHGGTEYQVPITVYYTKDGDPFEKSFSIDLPNIDPVKPKDPDPIDETKIIPSLTITSSKTTNGKAGKSTYIPIDITNSSNELAVDITATAEIDGDSPISIEGSGSQGIPRLRPGSTRGVDFKISIDQYAENKTYPIKINFQFYNDYGIYFTGSETVYVKVEDKSTKPLISIENVTTSPQVSEPDKPTTVSLRLKNNGTLEAKDVKISLGEMGSDTFTAVSGTNSKYIKSISGNSYANVSFTITPSKKLNGGNHGLDIVLNYKDGNNQAYEDSSKFFVKVASNKGNGSNLIIENLSYPQGSIGQNKDATIGFNLKNIGKIDAKNIKVAVESSDENGIVPKTVSIKKINSLAPNKSERLSFVFLTTKDAETRNYPINITVEYEDELNANEEKHTLTQYVGVYVSNPDEDAKGKPKLIIDKYNFEPSLVKAGEDFQMNLSFFNTNKTKAVKNIKIFLTADEKTDQESNSGGGGGNVFTPVNSSNTFYIDSIPPKGRVEKSITMSTVPDAQAKTYTITANFEYEDTQGEEYTAIELIGVPVIQQSKLEVGELNIPPETFVGESVPISAEFYNTGKVTLYNMMVKLEGDFQTEYGSYYVGNFATGNSEFFEGMVIPSEPGELTGDIVFTYEDSTGEIIEVREEFTLNVMDAPPMDEFPDGMPPEDEARGIKKVLKSKGFWITIILIGAGAGGFTFYKKRKKKGMALDE